MFSIIYWIATGTLNFPVTPKRLSSYKLIIKKLIILGRLKSIEHPR